MANDRLYLVCRACQKTCCLWKDWIDHGHTVESKVNKMDTFLMEHLDPAHQDFNGLKERLFLATEHDVDPVTGKYLP